MSDQHGKCTLCKFNHEGDELYVHRTIYAKTGRFGYELAQGSGHVVATLSTERWNVALKDKEFLMTQEQYHKNREYLRKLKEYFIFTGKSVKTVRDGILYIWREHDGIKPILNWDDLNVNYGDGRGVADGKDDKGRT